MRSKSYITRARVALAVVMAAGVLVIQAGTASAKSWVDCPSEQRVDIDYPQYDSGPSNKVDIGDGPVGWGHEPTGPMVMCYGEKRGSGSFVTEYNMTLRGVLFLDLQNGASSGCAWLAVSFSGDWENWGSKTWFKKCMSGVSEGMYERQIDATFTNLLSKDKVRLQLYQGSDAQDRVVTIFRKFGDG